jgi:hypothetical protein
MREELESIVCESLQCDNCIACCNYGPCRQVENIVDALIERGVILPD